MLFLKKFWKEIIGIILILTIMGAIYSYGYNSGKASVQNNLISLISSINDKVITIERSSTQIGDSLQESSNNLSKDMLDIRKQIAANKQPRTIIVNGKCEPSDVFIENLNKSIRKANEK